MLDSITNIIPCVVIYPLSMSQVLELISNRIFYHYPVLLMQLFVNCS